MNSRRIGRWAATLVLAAMAGSSIAWAQGSRYDNIVLSPQGKPLAAATVAVCTAAASTATTPCSPLATVYTDATLTTPAANPLTADGLGNYGFWAPPAKYLVQIYGSGITTKVNTVILPCDPTSNCTMGASSAISAFSLNLSGNLSVAGALTYSGGKTPAAESLSTDAVQFVSPTGNDANDGLSSGTAKLTVMAAYDALPAAGGTIFISNCAYATGCSAVSATSTAGQGIWILGTGDPNFSSPPTGWRKFKPTRFIGVGGVAASQNATSGVATAILAGSSTAPAIWLSASRASSSATWSSSIRASSSGSAWTPMGTDLQAQRPTATSFFTTSLALSSILRAVPRLGRPWTSARTSCGCFSMNALSRGIRRRRQTPTIERLSSSMLAAALLRVSFTSKKPTSRAGAAYASTRV